MTLPTFGIPEQTEAGGALQQAIAEHTDTLSGIGMHLANTIGQQLSAHEQAVGGVTSALRKQLGAKVGGLKRRLNRVAAAVSMPIDSPMMPSIPPGSRPPLGLPPPPRPGPAPAPNSCADPAHTTTPVEHLPWDAWIRCDKEFCQSHQNYGPYCLDVRRSDCGAITRPPPWEFLIAGPSWDITLLMPGGVIIEAADAFCHTKGILPPPPEPSPGPTPTPEPSPEPLPVPSPTPLPPMPQLVCCPVEHSSGSIEVATCSGGDLLAPSGNGVALRDAALDPGVIGLSLLPRPGSPDFCRQIEAIEKLVADVGRTQLNIALGVIPSTQGIAELLNKLIGIVPFVPEKKAKELSNALLAPLQAVENAICASKALLLGAMPQWCNFRVLLGVAILEQVVKLLAGSTVGLNVVFQGHLTFSITLDQLLQYLDYIRHHACPTQFPAGLAAIDLYLHGDLTPGEFECWVKCGNEDFAAANRIVYSRRSRQDFRQLLEVYRRADRGLALDQLRILQRQLGWTDAIEVAWQEDLETKFPRVDEAIRWERKGLLDPHTRATLHLEADNHPVVVKDVGDRGLDNYRYAIGGVNAGGPVYEVSHLRWMDSRELPALQICSRYVHRFRPTGGLDGGPRDPSGMVFGDVQFLQVAAFHGIPDWWGRLALAESYKPVPVNVMLRLHASRIVPAEQLVEAFMDDGFTRETAAWIVTAMDALEQSKKPAQQRNEDQRLARKAVIAEAIACVDIGSCSDTTAEGMLVSVGMERQYAAALVGAAVAKRTRVNILAQVREVKRAYHDGRIDRLAAERMLADMGTVPEQIAAYLALWTLQLTPSRKRRSAGQIESDLVNGFIDTPEAISRLRNLGYDNADTLLFVADANRKLAAAQAKMDAAQAKLATRQAAALAKVESEAAKIQREALAALRTMASPGTLAKWLRDGVITLTYYRERMKDLHFDDADIERYAEDACKKKGSRCVDNPPAPANGAGGGTTEPPPVR